MEPEDREEKGMERGGGARVQNQRTIRHHDCLLTSPLLSSLSGLSHHGFYCLSIDHQTLCLSADGRRWLSLGS